MDAFWKQDRHVPEVASDAYGVDPRITRDQFPSALRAIRLFSSFSSSL